MTEEEKSKVEMFAAAAIAGLVQGKIMDDGKQPTDAIQVARKAHLNPSNSITPQKVAHWAYEIAKEMHKKSKELK